MLAEAFVCGRGKPSPLAAGQHVADAAAAGLALVELLDAAGPLASHVRCSPHGSFSLLAAMALWAGLSIDPRELTQDALVIAPSPESGRSQHGAWHAVPRIS